MLWRRPRLRQSLMIRSEQEAVDAFLRAVSGEAMSNGSASVCGDVSSTPVDIHPGSVG